MSSDGCRMSVWHGAQLARILLHEMGSRPAHSTRLKLNPLIIPGVLMGAVATCYYAYQVLSCSSCAGVPVSETIDVFAVEQDDLKLVQWRNTAEGVAIWGGSGIPVCRCSVPALADWYRRLLAHDKAAATELEDFLVELGKKSPGT